MCGIAGFISSNKSYDASKIVNGMLHRMKHRGPDQRGVETYHNVTLGMIRLSIIDQEEHQIPYTDENSFYACVYNGEIYNHEEIKSRLGNKYNYKTSSDAETALLSFIDSGISSFITHNGMYSFAIYDKLNRTTYVVRDKVGEKPLYYYEGKDFFVFASEMKALLEIVEPKFNDAISYKVYEFTVGKETLFKGIFQLEPGEYIKIENKKVEFYNYWKVWDNLIEIKDDENKLIRDLSELIEDSILLRTHNCVHKLAVLISGGIDSALVASIAKPDYIYTSHYGFDDFDELTYAECVAKHINKKLIIVQPQKEDFLRTKEDIIYCLDTPCTWTSFTLWMLMKKIYEDGLKVTMTGDAADELFGGYHRYHLLYHDEQIRELEAMRKYNYLIDKYYGSPVDRYAKIVNRSTNIYDRKINQYLEESIGYYFKKLNKDVVHLMGLNDFYSTMQVLLQMSDRISMNYSIENRSPFLDYRLVQFAFSMPSKYKIRYGITKWILKQIARKFIPKEIVERVDKRGFSAPVNHWFKWNKKGKYDRSAYRRMVFQDWKKVYNVS